MALRISKKISTFLLILISIFTLSSCSFDDFVFPNVELNVSSNEQVTVLYQILDQVYYEELPLNLRKIETIEELLSYTDPYTYIYKINTRDIEKGENYVGLGITITEHPLGLLVVDLNEFTNIDEEIYIGDIIFKVGETALNTLEYNDKTALLQGLEGDIKEIHIFRGDEEVTVTRELAEIPFKSVSHLLINNIGYIKINRFGEDTSDMFLSSLTYLEENNIVNLIIDVRNNGGGYLDAVNDILRNFIIDENPFLYIYRVKEDRMDPFYSSNEEVKPYNISILVNENSASASEVLAGTMKKYDNLVYGERTYGKDVYQVGIDLHEVSNVFQEGDILNVTQGYWLLNDKTRVTGGLEPTIYMNQSGLLSLNYPVLNQKLNNDNSLTLVTYQKGEAHPLIVTYQYLLNSLYPFSYNLGYFNEEMEDILKIFQEEHNLLVNGILDLKTQMLLIDYYRTLIKDVTYDNQLNSLVNYLNDHDN